jgi:hypothetical protein
MPTIYWKQIESEIGFICARLLGIRTLRLNFFPNIFDASYPSSNERIGPDTDVRKNPQYTVSEMQRRTEDDFSELAEEHVTVTSQSVIEKPQTNSISIGLLGS